MPNSRLDLIGDRAKDIHQNALNRYALHIRKEFRQNYDRVMKVKKDLKIEGISRPEFVRRALQHEFGTLNLYSIPLDDLMDIYNGLNFFEEKYKEEQKCVKEFRVRRY